MKVYVVIDSGACDSVHETNIVGIFSDKEKAKEKFKETVRWFKEDVGVYIGDTDEIMIDGNWIITEEEDMFYAYDESYGSHNFENIWIEEREVE